MGFSIFRIKGRETSDKERDYRVTVSLNGCTIVDVFRGMDRSCARAFESWLKTKKVVRWHKELLQNELHEPLPYKYVKLKELSINYHIIDGNPSRVRNRWGAISMYDRVYTRGTKRVSLKDGEYKREIMVVISLDGSKVKTFSRSYIGVIDSLDDDLKKHRAIVKCLRLTNNWILENRLQYKVPLLCM